MGTDCFRFRDQAVFNMKLFRVLLTSPKPYYMALLFLANEGPPASPIGDAVSQPGTM